MAISLLSVCSFRLPDDWTWAVFNDPTGEGAESAARHFIEMRGLPAHFDPPLENQEHTPRRVTPAATYDAMDRMMDAMPRIAPPNCKDSDTCCDILMNPLKNFMMHAIPAFDAETLAFFNFEWQSKVTMPLNMSPMTDWNQAGVAFKCRHSMAIPPDYRRFSPTEGYRGRGGPYHTSDRLYSRTFFLICHDPEVLMLLNVRRRFSMYLDTIAVCVDSKLKNRWTKIGISSFYYPNVDQGLYQSQSRKTTRQDASTSANTPAIISITTQVLSAGALLKFSADLLRPMKCIDLPTSLSVF